MVDPWGTLLSVKLPSTAVVVPAVPSLVTTVAPMTGPAASFTTPLREVGFPPPSANAAGIAVKRAAQQVVRSNLIDFHIIRNV